MAAVTRLAADHACDAGVRYDVLADARGSGRSATAGTGA
jgi:hypothetical protein